MEKHKWRRLTAFVISEKQGMLYLHGRCWCNTSSSWRTKNTKKSCWDDQIGKIKIVISMKPKLQCKSWYLSCLPFSVSYMSYYQTFCILYVDNYACFLMYWKKSHQPREDSKEFLQLCLIFLYYITLDKVSFRAPEPIHHVR